MKTTNKLLLTGLVLTSLAGTAMGATTTTIIQGKNAYLIKTTDTSGNSNYKVNLNNNLYDLGTATFHSNESGTFTGGNSTIAGDKINIRNLDNKRDIYITPRNITITNLEYLPESIESTELTSDSLYIQKGNYNIELNNTGLWSTNTKTGQSVQFSTVVISAGEQQIHNVTAGTEDTDAVNVSQLKDYVNENKTIVQSGDNNINVTENNNVYTVSMNKNINAETVGLNDGNSESTYSTKGIDMIYRGDAEYHSHYNYDGMKIDILDGNGVPVNHISLTENGLDNGGKTITNVDRGVNDTDAVNISQLKDVSSKVDDNKKVIDNHEGRITSNENHISDLENKINDISSNAIKEANSYTDSQVAHVGAQSAALAGLHPLDFNKDDKASYAASVGHYRNANAVAVGAFYRPNERTMVSGAVSFGKHAQMNLGVAFKVGKGSEYINEAKSKDSRIEKLEALVEKLTAEVEELKASK